MGFALVSSAWQCIDWEQVTLEEESSETCTEHLVYTFEGKLVVPSSRYFEREESSGCKFSLGRIEGSYRALQWEIELNC